MGAMKWNFLGIVAENLEESVRFYRLLGCPSPIRTVRTISRPNSKMEYVSLSTH